MPRISSTLEALEPRIAPANVTAVFTNGLLVVKPTDVTESMVASVVQTSADGFSVFGDGVLVDTFTEVEAVRVLGGAAQDTITFDALDTAADRFAGDVSLFGRAGREDAISVLAGQIAGDLRIRAGNEALVSVADGALVGGTVNVQGTHRMVKAQLDGNFGAVVTGGLEELIFTGAEVAGDLRVAGDGAFNATVRLLGGTEVAGDVIFRGGTSPFAYLDIRNSAVGGAVLLSGTVEGFQSDAADSSFGGSFTVALGASSGGCSFASSSVQGAVRVTGSGTTVGASFGGSFVAGPVTVIATGASISSGVGVDHSTVAGKITVLVSQGASGVRLAAGSALGGVTLHGAGGWTEFQSDAASVVAGNVELTVTDGRGVCRIAEPGDLRSVRFRSGDRTDSLEIGGTGSAFLVVDAVFGSGNDQVSFGTDVFSTVRLNGGAGDDALTGADALIGPRVSIRSFELRD